MTVMTQEVRYMLSYELPLSLVCSCELANRKKMPEYLLQVDGLLFLNETSVSVFIDNFSTEKWKIYSQFLIKL